PFRRIVRLGRAERGGIGRVEGGRRDRGAGAVGGHARHVPFHVVVGGRAVGADQDVVELAAAQRAGGREHRDQRLIGGGERLLRAAEVVADCIFGHGCLLFCWAIAPARLVLHARGAIAGRSVSAGGCRGRGIARPRLRGDAHAPYVAVCCGAQTSVRGRAV